MELREFIKTSIIEVIGGIEDAISSLNENGSDAKINPLEREGVVSSKDTIGYRKVQNMEMDIALTIENKGNSKVGIGVLGGMFNAGASTSESGSNKSVSSVKFTIPIAFPCTQP